MLVIVCERERECVCVSVCERVACGHQLRSLSVTLYGEISGKKKLDETR